MSRLPGRTNLTAQAPVVLRKKKKKLYLSIFCVVYLIEDLLSVIECERVEGLLKAC